jgi:hypothetical protein
MEKKAERFMPDRSYHGSGELAREQEKDCLDNTDNNVKRKLDRLDKIKRGFLTFLLKKGEQLANIPENR